MSQKNENLLSLALDATEEERQKSRELDVGYNPIDREWDLIIKYSESLDTVRALAQTVTQLANEYAIITIRESAIEELAALPQIEYIEKPKMLFFQLVNGKRVSCINPVQQPPFSLFGNGVLVAVLDSGIDYTLADFRNADGTTRIRALWDQTIQGNPPVGYNIGTEYTMEQINNALQQENRMAREEIVPSQDTSGHGTSVAGIAAGNGSRTASSQIVGVAPLSELLIVKLGNPREDSFPRTTELMQAVDYAVRKGIEYQMPVSINISFGNTYGPHDGTSLLERFLDEISNFGRTTISVGSGNEGTSSGHTSGTLVQGTEEIIRLGVQMNEPTVSVQIWKSYVDDVDISIESPSGVRVGPLQQILGPQRFVLGQTEILLYYGEPSPYSVKQEIFIDFLPRDSYINSGEWKIILTPKRLVTGEYQMWLPSQGVLNQGTGFLFPKSDATLTIPSTAGRVITVGAYDALTFSYADFSGRGIFPTGTFSTALKPDLVAPGVRVTTVVPGGTYAEVTGTSFSTPFVTGSAALLMEWGIVNGNDPYLYGEKVKAYLRRGARELPGFDEWPNNLMGYGALCVRDSIPV
ncbi:S8 family peptidase [Clostridium sp. C105KSO13]|uniref:S8 family peptidase n=1 Tax=Clostridium sp. C105KSO13 TaxID=1776045 RepID=UPI00074058EC|nr:S8 family peptidase [Clostridium sp. C105KSO13]CUX20070.1 PIII-type proteinase precursor [Clostridium sp. C105KSO13]